MVVVLSRILTGRPTVVNALKGKDFAGGSFFRRLLLKSVDASLAVIFYPEKAKRGLHKSLLTDSKDPRDPGQAELRDFTAKILPSTESALKAYLKEERKALEAEKHIDKEEILEVERAMVTSNSFSSLLNC